MKTRGPDVATLTRRLGEAPEEFLAAPRIGPTGVIDVVAVAADLIWAVRGSPIDPRSLALEVTAASDANLQRVRLLAMWLLQDGGLRRAELVPRMIELLAVRLGVLAQLVDAELFVRDADRREELVRVVLDGLGLVPAGETEAIARDRLAALDSVERRRVVEAARGAEERARKVRAEMAAKAATEAAAKASRE